jgi:serine/threonine protein kinase
MAGEPTSGLDPEQLMGERIATRFVVERLIGHGPLSTAFRAYDDRLHRRVTVKLFHPRHRDDVAVVESQLAIASHVARLAHEHIAVVIDRGEHDGMPLLVLEYVRGENLHERIERFAPLAVAEVVGYGLQIARALTYAHGQHVMHGNLRPENVLLTEDRDVKLVDFGGGSYVAQLVGDPYAAPELREVDAGAPSEPTDDIYALGALLFTALTEHTPPAGLGAADMQAVRPDVSPRLASAIAMALATNPLDRHGSMRAFAAELAAAQASLGGANPAAAGVAHTREGVIDASFGATQSVPVTAATTRSRGERRRAAVERGQVTDHDRTTGSMVHLRTTAPRRRRYVGETRARLLAWSMVLVPIAALVIVGFMIAGERGSDQVKGASTPGSNGPVRLVEPSSITTFDPKPGDGSERQDLIANINDGDPKTAWQTEGYDLPTLSGNKPGVGVMLRFDTPQDFRDMSFITGLPGWTVEARVADTPAATIGGWRLVSKPTAVNSNVKIPIDMHGATAQYLLIWITRLSVDVDDANHFRARIGELSIFATASSAATDSSATNNVTADPSGDARPSSSPSANAATTNSTTTTITTATTSTSG